MVTLILEVSLYIYIELYTCTIVVIHKESLN